jgi:hypothetical protein
MLEPEPLVPVLRVGLPEPLVPDPGPVLPAAPELAPPMAPPGAPELPLIPGVAPLLGSVSDPDGPAVPPPGLMPVEPLVLPPLVCAQAPPLISSATAAVARIRYI